MKQTVEFTDYELLETLKESIKDIFEDRIQELINTESLRIIKEEVGKKLKPLIDETIETHKFLEHHGWMNDYEGEETISDMVKKEVKKYLDEKVYLYSKTDETLSGRYAKDSNPSSRDPSRLESYVRFVIAKYFDENTLDIITPIVEEFLKDRENLEKLAKEEMSALLKNKFNL
jgi:hypothetical protein